MNGGIGMPGFTSCRYLRTEPSAQLPATMPISVIRSEDAVAPVVSSGSQIQVGALLIFVRLITNVEIPSARLAADWVEKILGG